MMNNICIVVFTNYFVCNSIISSSSTIIYCYSDSKLSDSEASGNCVLIDLFIFYYRHDFNLQKFIYIFLN